MIKNRDFYVHVFAPITAIILFGYMFNTQPYGAHTFNGIVLYTIIRAVMGLCIGAISWKLTYWFSYFTKRDCYCNWKQHHHRINYF